MNRKKALDAAAASHARNQACHPVIAMNQVRSGIGDNMIDNFPLENHGNFRRFLGVTRIHLLAVVKNPVFSEMDVGIGQNLVVCPQLLFVKTENITLEHAAVVRQGDVDIRAEFKECGNERGRDIGEASGFGGHALRIVPHS